MYGSSTVEGNENPLIYSSTPAGFWGWAGKGHKPCSHAGDLGPGLGVLFNVHRPVGLLLPHGGLIISVNDVKLNINIGEERRAPAVGGAHPEAVLRVLSSW